MSTATKRRETIQFEAEGVLRQVPRLRYGLASPVSQPHDWRSDPNNPNSPNFVPLTERTERDKARFWALFSRKSRRQDHGVFDA